VKEGLSQAAVQDLLQDPKGFMWIATRDGLNRYDGQSFITYYARQGDSTSLNNNQVWGLTLDSQGNLWVSTDFGMGRYDYQQDQFHQHIPIPSAPYHRWNNLLSLYALRNDDLLVGTRDGVLYFDQETEEFRYDLFPELRDLQTYSFLETDSALFIGTNYGLFVYDLDYEYQQTFDELPLEVEIDRQLTIHALYQDSQGRIWIGTARGLHQYLPAEKRLVPYLNKNVPDVWNEIHDILEDEQGQLWLANNVLQRFKDSVFLEPFVHDPADAKSLSGDLSYDLGFSQDGVLWVGTNGYGLNVFNPNRYPFHLLQFQPDRDFSLNHAYVGNFFETPEGWILVGTAQGLDVVDFEHQQVIHSQPLYYPGSQKRVRINFFKSGSQAGVYWVGTNMGLLLYDLNTRQLSLPPFSMTIGGVNSMVWINSEEAILGSPSGLYRYHSATGAVYAYPIDPDDPTTMNYNVVTNLTQIGQEVWVGTTHGLCVLDLASGKFRPYSQNPTDGHSLPNDYVKNVFEDRDGTIWVTTWGGGFARYRPDTDDFLVYNTAAGLPNNVVYGIMQDEAGYLWMSTNAGLSRFDPDEESFFNFSEADGLQSDEFNTGAYLKASDGTFYFGGINGVNWFRPEEIEIKTNAPPTLITEFHLTNQPGGSTAAGILPASVLEKDTLVLDYDQNDFRVRVAALDFLSEEPNAIRYRLLPYESEWQNPGPQSYLNYTSLAPGTYRLEVQAASHTGYWDDPGDTLVIRILSPFWQQSWFRGLAILAFVVCIWGGFRWRAGSLRRRNAQLAQLVDERTRTIQERNEEIATQNEEIEQQNVELKYTSDDLAKRNVEMARQRTELRKIKKNLEVLVDQRNQELISANEELAEQNNQLEQFAFITAHNLKSPISQFEGLLSILPPLDSFEEYTQNVIGRLKGSAQDLKETVADLNLILDIKKGVGLTFTIVDLGSILAKVVDSLTPEAEQNAVTLKYPEGTQAYVRGLAPYLQSIVYNLLHNAIKYADPQKPASWVEVSVVKEQKWVTLQIADNGIGLDMALAKDKLFRLYQRFNTSHPGKGFGLFLVKTQVEAMGGKVSMDSKKGEGSLLKVTIPAANAKI